MTAQVLFTQTQSQSELLDLSESAASKTAVGKSQGQRSLPPLVILHGLFGSWENWASRVREYARHTTVYAMDLRNHGNSPHCETMSYPEMAADVIHTMDQLGVDSCDLLGHSMGGKVAMQMASANASRIARLVVVDIAPKSYPPQHSQILNALRAIDVSALQSRREADQELAKAETDPVVRAFILKNLVRTKAKEGSQSATHFRWQINLQSLNDNYPELLKAPTPGAPFASPTLFIKGSESDYLEKSDQETILKHFPRVELKVISGTGHWPHAEKPSLFDRALGGFLEYNQ